MNSNLKFVTSFNNSKNHTQPFFEALIKTALIHKYKNAGLSVVPVNAKILTDSIFGLTSHDSLQLWGTQTVLNGQKFKEVFITNIICQAFERLRKDKAMILAVPEREESFDTLLYITDPDGCAIHNDYKIRFSKEVEAHYFQIKEYFDWDEAKNDKLLLVPKPLTAIGDIEKLKLYDESLIIYARVSRGFTSNDAKKLLTGLSDKKIFIIANLLESFEVGGKTIKIKDGKYNFLLIDLWKDEAHHLFFNEPASFRKSPFDFL